MPSGRTAADRLRDETTKHGEILVGPRYRYDDARHGADRTFLLETDGAVKGFDPHAVVQIPKPVAGAIWRRGYGKHWFCWCESCHAITRTYKRKNEPALRKWAHQHRCNEEGSI